MAMARLNLSQLLLPFLRIFIARVRADRARRGEFIAPVPRPHSFDNHPRIMALLSGRYDRIEWYTPSAPQNIDQRRGVGTRRHRPQRFIDMGDIDVLVNDDNVASQIGAGVALAGDESGLLRMARISLFDRDDNHKSLRRRRPVKPFYVPRHAQ